MFEVWFLFGLSLVWIIFATVEDIKTREISNWLNFSLIFFVLSFRFFYSLFELSDFNFFYQGFYGYILFFIIGNLFYYGRMFAGGDAKLMISLGAVLPIFPTFIENTKLFVLFLFLFLIVGSVYGLLVSLYFGFRNFGLLKKEIPRQFELHKNLIISILGVSVIFLGLGFFIKLFFYWGILFFIFPYIYLYLVSIDKSCMVRLVDSNSLTEGDWLYEDIFVGNKKVKANWDGLSQKDLKFLSKLKRKILVRYGIQFAPVFLITFILYWVIIEFDLFNYFLNFFLF